MLKNKLRFSFTLIFLFFTISCGKIDTTDISCEKMSNNSSVSIDELLGSPETIKIENTDFNLMIVIPNTISNNIDSFPLNILPKFENNCSKSSGYMYTNSNSNILTKFPEKDTYKLERIWFIDSKKQVWETSKLIFIDYLATNPNEFAVQGLVPNLNQNRPINAVLKFNYNNKSYFIKSQF